MRALFVNEVRRGRILVFAGLAIGAALALSRGLYGVYPPLISDTKAVELQLSRGLYFMSFLIAILSGAGLFASEAERGTIPLLLALPLSRRRIWLAKVLAALTTACLATGLLLAVALPALPLVDYHDSCLPNPPAAAWVERAPVTLEEAIAAALWWIVLFSTSCLFSTLLEHVVGVISMTIISGIGLFALTIAVTDGLGGSLSGVIDEDPALWAIMLIPAFVVGSYFAFSRGELLRSRRRWAVAGAAFTAAAAIVVGAVIGYMRLTTRYEHALVQHIRPVAVSRDAGVVALWGLRLPVTLGILSRVRVAVASPPPADAYRSRYLVLVDTDSGRELLVRRGIGTGALSPDGRLLAVIPEAFALTWRLRLSGMPTKGIEIRRLRDGHLLYAGWPSDHQRFGWPGDQALEWCPDSSWLAVESRYDWHRLLVMRRDGRRPVGLRLAPEYNLNPQSTYQASSPATPQRWAWDPRGAGMYLLTDDTAPAPGAVVLARCDLPSGVVTPIWKPAADLPPGYDWLTGAIAPSPDGKLLAVGMAAVPFQPSPYGGRPEPSWNGRSLVFVFLVSPDGSRRQLLSRSGFQYLYHNYRCGVTDWAWSKDGTRLWYLVKSEYGDRRELFLWRKGDTAATRLALPLDYVVERIAALPGRAEALVWGGDAAFIADEQGRIRRLPGVTASHDARQRLLLGVDGRGRAVVCDANPWGGAGRLGLVDLDSGRFRQVYP